MSSILGSLGVRASAALFLGPLILLGSGNELSAEPNLVTSVYVRQGSVRTCLKFDTDRHFANPVPCDPESVEIIPDPDEQNRLPVKPLPKPEQHAKPPQRDNEELGCGAKELGCRTKRKPTEPAQPEKGKSTQEAVDEKQQSPMKEVELKGNDPNDEWDPFPRMSGAGTPGAMAAQSDAQMQAEIRRRAEERSRLAREALEKEHEEIIATIQAGRVGTDQIFLNIYADIATLSEKEWRSSQELGVVFRNLIKAETSNPAKSPGDKKDQSPKLLGRSLPPSAQEMMKRVMTKAGLQSCVISSTSRTPDQQAEEMYKYRVVQGLDEARKLYGKAGEIVLNVYEANKALPKDEILEKMKSEMRVQIGRLEALGDKRTELMHVSDLNITFDIALSSISDQWRLEQAIRDEMKEHPGEVVRFLMPPFDKRAFHIELRR